MTEQKYKHVAPCQDYLPDSPKMQKSRHQDEVAEKTLIERIFAEGMQQAMSGIRMSAEDKTRLNAGQMAEIRERYIYH